MIIDRDFSPRRVSSDKWRQSEIRLLIARSNVRRPKKASNGVLDAMKNIDEWKDLCSSDVKITTIGIFSPPSLPLSLSFVELFSRW